MMAQNTDASRELVSLSERMVYLQILRAGFAAAVLLSATFAASFIQASLQELLWPAVAYVTLTAGVEGARRLGKGRGLYAIAGMLLLDGVFLAWIAYETGGTESSLRFLVFIHLIGVALLASYRTGLKIALWHSLLMFVVFHAQLAGILASGGKNVTTKPSIFNVMALWAVALATAAFSSLNEREIRRRNGELESLAKMGVELEDKNDAASIGQSLLASVCDAFGFQRGIVLAGPKGEMELLAAEGVEASEGIPAGVDKVVRRAWDTREVLTIRKLHDADDRIAAELLPGARNLLVVPLLADGEALGVMVVESGGRRARIERRVLAMVSQFASHAALELRNAWLVQQIRWLAQTDELTGLANRRAFQESLQQEVDRAKRDGQELTLVMLDLDHFKLLNDTYGHLAGDDVLRQVGMKLKAACRGFDMGARFGGEEFAILLPACTSQGSFSAASRFRKLIAEVEFVTDISASAGVATFPTHANDAIGLLNAADAALYEAKRLGRDRLVRARKGMFDLPPQPQPGATPADGAVAPSGSPAEPSVADLARATAATEDAGSADRSTRKSGPASSDPLMSDLAAR